MKLDGMILFQWCLVLGRAWDSHPHGEYSTQIRDDPVGPSHPIWDIIFILMPYAHLPSHASVHTAVWPSAFSNWRALRLRRDAGEPELCPSMGLAVACVSSSSPYVSLSSTSPSVLARRCATPHYCLRAPVAACHADARLVLPPPAWPCRPISHSLAAVAKRLCGNPCVSRPRPPRGVAPPCAWPRRSSCCTAASLYCVAQLQHQAPRWSG